MESQKTGLFLVKKVYNQSFKTFKKSPTIFYPFLIFVISELVSLAIIYFLPRMPLVKVLGPPIRTLWGEGYLHYPTNFLLYPKLLSLSRMGLTVVLGSLLTGVAVSMVFTTNQMRVPRIGQSFKTAVRQYINLFIVVLIFTLLYYFLSKVLLIGMAKYFMTGRTKLLFLGPAIWFGPILICLNFVVAILIQSAFVYAIPLLIIDKQKLLQSLFKSFVLFGRLFLPTIILVGLPMLLFIPKVILDFNTALLINELFPEIIVVVAIFGIALNSLIIDFLITVSTTILFLINKENQ